MYAICQNVWILRKSADASYGVLSVCAIFQKTVRLPLAVLVLSVLIFLALMKRSPFDQLAICSKMREKKFQKREGRQGMPSPKSEERKGGFKAMCKRLRPEYTGMFA